jgi:hypothetical protein
MLFSPHPRRSHQYASPTSSDFLDVGEAGEGSMGVYPVNNPSNRIAIDCNWIFISDISAKRAYLELNAGNSYYSKRE